LTGVPEGHPSLRFNDKESLTADPVHPGVAYAVWDRLQNIVCPPGVPRGGSGETDKRPFRGGSVGEAAAPRRRQPPPTR
jgi:hypothetical protein